MDLIGLPPAPSTRAIQAEVQKETFRKEQNHALVLLFFGHFD